MANSGDDIPRLVVIDPPELRDNILLLSRSRIIVGHSATGQLILDDSYGSRRHALIKIDESGSVTIRDLNSVSGTFVNQVRLEGPRVLQRGDIVRFTDHVARFEPASTSPPGVPPPRVSPVPTLPLSAGAKTVPRAVAKAPTAASSPDAAGADIGTTDAQAAGPVSAPAVTMPPAPAPRPTAAAGVAVADLAPVLGAGSSELITALAGHGITTLADVRQAGDLSAITTPAQATALQLLEAHADLARLSSDVTANAKVIAAGFSGTLAIARAPQASFVTAAAPALGEAGAITMHSQAVAMYNALDQLLIGAHIDAAAGVGSGFSDRLDLIINPPDLQVCLCEDCQSAPGPTAYLADLLSYVASHLRSYGLPVGLPFLAGTFHQPFADLPTDCAAVETEVRQVRICAEVLRSYLAAPAHAPTAAQQAELAIAEAAYVLAAYKALLAGLGTSFDELQLARYADPATRSSLAGRLGLTVDPYGAGRPDGLDLLVLDPAAVPPSPHALTEPGIERIFGLANTNRNPLSDGPVLLDLAGLITRWNLDGVTWDRNTDPDGTIYLTLSQPSAAEFDVSLYSDRPRTHLVASGQLPLPAASFPATISVNGDSGLSGTIEVSGTTASQAITLQAIPALSSWQLQTLRAEWLAEDHPADAYTAVTSVTPLAALPASVTIPGPLQAEIAYDSSAKVLSCTGVMAPADLAQLLALAPAGTAGHAYTRAVRTLYVQSQRPPVIDPDVIGPDDFRSPVPAAPGDPAQPYDVWLNRRTWVFTRLTALQGITASAPAGTAFTAMLNSMYSSVSYLTTNASPWAATTPVGDLEYLWENLAEGADVTANTLRVAGDLSLTVQAFNRLMDLRHQDQAAPADPRNPPLSDADWLEVASLLTGAAKTRFFAAWRAEEAALPLVFGPAAFVVSLTEPQPGDWPPVLPAGTPLIDPALVPLTGLPDPVAGARAIKFWHDRATQVAGLTSQLRSINEASGGFQAMLEQALGDPAAGDPLPVDTANLAQQLVDPDPAFVATATTTIQSELFMTADQFTTVMTAQTMAASANPLTRPTAAQWNQVYAILTAAETKKRLYPQWLTQEQNPASGVTYWTARKAALQLWRASADQRSQWQAALAGRSRAPIIDPDLIGPADMVSPATADPAFSLWWNRSQWLFNLSAGPLPTASLTAFDNALLSFIAVTGEELEAIARQAAAGGAVTARLAQLNLTYPAFTQLMGVRSLIKNGITPLDSEIQAVQAILIQVSKQRMYPEWLQAEADRGIILGPDEFQLPAAGTASPDLPGWRATADARQAWEATLQARVEQQNTVLGAAADNADATEGATLTQLRDALVLATDAPAPAAGTPPTLLKAKADWLTTSLMIDAETGGSVKTTRVEQAIETLQDLMTGLRDGQIGGFELTLTSAPAAIAFSGTSRYDLFARGPDNGLWHKWWDTTWHDWESLGGTLLSAPAAASQAQGTVDIFVLGADGAIWQRAYNAGGWGTWKSLGGTFAQGPAAGSQIPGNLDVFAVDQQGLLWQLSGQQGGWGLWHQAARTAPPVNGIASAPSVVASGTGIYDVFAKGADTQLWHTRLDGTWAAWDPLGSALAAAPSATAAGGTLEVFILGTDGAIWSLTGQAGGGWGTWQSLAGFSTQGPGALADNDVFSAGSGGVLQHKWLDGASGWVGWETTTKLSMDAPDFDAEWTWMGSYATWRAAIMVLLYPENLLDPTLRDQQHQTPAFRALVTSVQQNATLTPDQLSQMVSQYDTYYRDVCSLNVQASCNVTAGPAPQTTLLYMFGIAANSQTAYWSTYNSADQSGYAQTFWDSIPGLGNQQLVSLSAATSLIDPNGKLWVLLVFIVNTSSGLTLAITRYDPVQCAWEQQVYPLPVQPEWASFTAQLGFQGSPQLFGQNSGTYPPGIVVTTPDGRYERTLSANGTDWSAIGWARVGSWGPWTQATAADVSSGQAIAAVSRTPGLIDLFWVDSSDSIVSTAESNLAVNSGTLGGVSQIDIAFTAGDPIAANLAPTVIVRTPDHFDIFVIGAGPPAPHPPGQPPGFDLPNIFWNWQDNNFDGGQWHTFENISVGDDIINVAAVARNDGNRNYLHVFGLGNDGIVRTTWSGGPPGEDSWQPWIQMPTPFSGSQDIGETNSLQLSAVSPDPQTVIVTVTNSDGDVSGYYWQDGSSWVSTHGWIVLNESQPSAASSPLTAISEGADVVDVLYLSPATSVLLSRPDYSAGNPVAVPVTSLGGSLHGGAPVAALARSQDRVEVYVAGPGTPGTSIWTRSTDDPGDPGSWSGWTAISNDGGDISTLAAPWRVAAVSQLPQRTDLFAALLGTTGGSPGVIYTTYWQDVDFGPPDVQLPPFSPVPIVSAPLDIPGHLSSTDLQNRSPAIKQAFEANLAVPPGFTQAAPASMMTYLQEAYYFVPVYLANQLRQQGQFTAALDWYRTTYDYSVPEQISDIYYGLVLEEGPPQLYTLPAGWLADPLNPHAIAMTRHYAYTRYTVLQIVGCLFAYADSLFTTDTSESDAQARTLYMTGLSLLSLPIFDQYADSCAGLTIEVLDIPVDPAWQPMLAIIAADLATIGRPAALAPLIPKITSALGGKDAWPDRFSAARALITGARRDLPPRPTVSGVLAALDTRAAAAYSALLSIPAVDAAATGVSATAAAASGLAAGSAASGPPAADAKPAAGQPSAGQPGGQEAPLRTSRPILKDPEPGPQPPDPGPPGGFNLPTVDFWFCAPVNPVIGALQAHGELCLYELRHGMNIAGMTRQVDPYSAPTDSGSGLPTIGSDGQLMLPGAVTLQPTAYPYATLIKRAQQLVQTAAQIEAQMLAALQQYQQAAYAELQARQNLTVTDATVQLQSLTAQQAAASVTLAQLQQQNAQMQASYWQQLQGSDIGSLEQSAITAQQTEKGLQIEAGVAGATTGLLEAVATFGATSGSFLAAGLTSAAGVSATAAQIDNAQASLELQQDSWQFQLSQSQEAAQIAGQQITIATDQVRVAGQQLAIAQLQAGNAADTLNFLVNQFLNAPLYDWMAGVLQGVYSYFLQQATAVALLAENQMAFERQEVPPGFIKSNYWQPASANLLAAGTSDTMGLTGAEQLTQDITELDQYYFSTDQRRLQLTKTISLAQLYPVDFQQLRETGVMNFSTPLTLFDQDFPGHYMRLIQQVSTSVIALIPPVQGIKATLSCTGASQVVIGPDVFQTVVVRTDPQSVAITTPLNATGVLSTDPQSELLLPFQELGVAAQWEFSMPLAANQFDFSTLADVQITINYTALADPGYRAQVIRSLDGQVSQERPYSFVNDLPDQWYDLNNPFQTATPMTVQFTVAATDFPANLNDIRIQQVILSFARADGASFEIPVSSLLFFEGASTAAVGGAATTIGGIISTRRGNAASWIPMIGSTPFGTWQLTLPDTQVVRDWFTSQQITDILFDITYTAKTPPWPA